MKERGKAVEEGSKNDDNFSDFNFLASSEMPCQKHPSSSPVGICPYCLKDRLVKLVCSECGEQRLSSCSCSDVSSSYRNSCSTMEVGSVGRVSFLIENDKVDPPNPKWKRGEDSKQPEQVIFLRRSSSSCVEVKRSNGFWRIKRLFKKKRSGKDNGECCDEKSEIWVSDIMGVSRSRSLCSFRGAVGYSDPDEGSEYALSSAKISDVTSGVFLDQYSESESRKSGFKGDHGFADFRGGKRVLGSNPPIELDRSYSVQNRSVFPAKESDFSTMDESAFIDLKLDLSEPKVEGRVSGASDQGAGIETGGSFKGSKAVFGSSGSCRMSASERGLKRGSRNHKIWKWIFKYHHTGIKKKEILKS
ncbi:uncharacterized protein LOC127245504 [Andrographis paniculata]|uniref:uncharacterized protein LOC127245504 n=1 Tax=Andrographis paniculata TaxID=175694 RepID=UPI0021E9579C|nr:uncharacterized protein LOC127245504 [Andrographis paniculata]